MHALGVDSDGDNRSFGVDLKELECHVSFSVRLPPSRRYADTKHPRRPGEVSMWRCVPSTSERCIGATCTIILDQAHPWKQPAQESESGHSRHKSPAVLAHTRKPLAMEWTTRLSQRRSFITRSQSIGQMYENLTFTTDLPIGAETIASFPGGISSVLQER